MPVGLKTWEGLGTWELTSQEAETVCMLKHMQLFGPAKICSCERQHQQAMNLMMTAHLPHGLHDAPLISYLATDLLQVL